MRPLTEVSVEVQSCPSLSYHLLWWCFVFGLSVVVLAGALLHQCLNLLAKGVHPTVISDALFRASDKAVEVGEKVFIPDQALIIKTSMRSGSHYSLSHLFGIACQAVCAGRHMQCECTMLIINILRPYCHRAVGKI